MKRRRFISIASVAGTGTLISPALIQCSTKKKEVLLDLIGNDIAFINKYNPAGNENFSYASLNVEEFDTEYKAKSISIYTEQQKIVGYTLLLRDNIFNELTEKYGKSMLAIKNDFGEKWVWNSDSLSRSLTIVNSNSNILYSCYTTNNNLVVF